MAKYDILETGFSSLDETINFGIRAVGTDSLYEIGTIAVLRSSEITTTLDPLKIVSYYQQDRIFFSINKVLRIIKEKEIWQEMGILELDYIIDTFCISSCGKFLLICTQDGKITIRTVSYDFGNEDVYAFSVVFVESLEPCYFTASFVDGSTFYVITDTGLVKQIALDMVNDVFKSEVVFDFNRNIKICAFGYPYICLEGNELIMLNVDSKSCQYDDVIGLKEIHAVGPHFIASDDVENIYIIEPSELIIFCVNERFPHLVNRFDTICFVEDGEKTNKVYLLAITKDLPEKKREIQLLTFPESNVVYSLLLEGPVHLTNIKNLTEEVAFFTEIRTNNIVSEIRLQVIITANPEFRIAKLIQKQLFDEAEVFARTFNVSSEIVAKAKAQHIVNKLVCTTEDIDQLLNILNTINDQLFKLNCCDIVDCELETDTRRVLRYGALMNVDVKDCSKNRDTEILITKRRLNEKLHRFETYMDIYDIYDNDTWTYFVSCDLINEMNIYLQKGEMEKATVISNRLDHKLISHEKIVEIMSMLNKDLGNRTFLSSFIPISLKYVPDSLAVFVQWLHDRVFQLEKQCSVEFPDCAVKFVEEFTKLMTLATPVKRHISIEDSQNQLARLSRALGDLKLLLNLGIKFHLYEFLTGPSNFIRTLFKANMNNVNFEALMVDFVCPFILKNNMNMDRLLEEEIENMLIYEEEYWISIVQVLLRFITSVDKKLELTYKILEATCIPWSISVKNITKITCQLAPTHPVAEKIVKHMSSEQILVILRKYNIHRPQFDSLDDKIFYFNRMIYLNKPTLFEDIQQLCIDVETRHEADLLLINKLLLKENYDKAMSIIDSSRPEKIIVLCKNILDRSLEFAVSYDIPEKFRNPYYIALNLIWTRLKKNSKRHYCDIKKLEFDYKLARTVYEINKYFKMQVQIPDLLLSVKRENILDTLIREAASLQIGDDVSNIDTFLFNCKRLAFWLEMDLDTVLRKCLVKCKILNPFLRVGEYLLNTSECSKLLCCWSMFLFKYLNDCVADDCEETFLGDFYDISKDQEGYLEGLQLAKKLSIKAIMFATSEDHSAVIEVIRWIDCCFYLSDISKYSNPNILQILPSSNALNRGIKSVEAIKSVFRIYCNTLGLVQKPNTKYLTCFTTNISTCQFQKEMEQFLWYINIIIEDEQHLTAFNVIKTLQQGFLCNTDIPKDTVIELQSKIQTSLLPKMLEAILSYEYVDKILLLNVILLCENYEKQILNSLQHCRKQPNKLNIIAQVGMELCKHHKITTGKGELTNILKLCKWWNRITDKNSISYTFFFSAKPVERLETLILAKQLHLGYLPEYCVDFHLNLQNGWLKYLEVSLKCWQPKENESQLATRCQNAIKCIKNRDQALTLIDHLWPSINFYYYEVFIVMLSIRSKLSTTSKPLFEAYQQLLSFLKGYKRVSSPSRSEVEQWFGTFPQEAFIDPLSECRLPFTSTFFSSDIWTIIKPEVNLETYKEWFKVATVLEQFLNINDICTYAINSSIPTGLTKSSCNSWELYPKYEHLIAKVEECAKYITDLERATAAVYNLMCNMAPGIDKVKMAELSYKYARIYRQSMSCEAVEKVYNKVKKRYFNYSAIHILHKYELAEEKYLMLVAQPLELISKLYEDSRIPKQICSVSFSCPDINKAVDELCILFDLTAKNVKYDVLLGILKSNTTLDLELTHATDFAENQDTENDCFMRACYICSSTDFRKSLVKIGMNRDNVDTNMSLRGNALKCFYYTSNLESIEKMSGMNPEQFLTFMNKVSLIARISELGIRFKTVEQLDEFNKKKLLKALAQINQPLAIKCIACICKIYGLDDLKYWEFIVNTAVKFDMIKDLYHYVEFLRFRCPSNFIINAWNVILNDAFASHADINKDATTLKLLQTSPVIYELNFNSFIEKCISNKKLEIAAVLLQYVPIEKHEDNLKVILEKESIAEDVTELKNKGITGIDKVIKILKHV